MSLGITVLIIRDQSSPDALWLCPLTTPPGTSGLVTFQLAHIRLLSERGPLPKVATHLGSRLRWRANSSRRGTSYPCCDINHSRADRAPGFGRADDAPPL